MSADEAPLTPLEQALVQALVSALVKELQDEDDGDGRERERHGGQAEALGEPAESSGWKPQTIAHAPPTYRDLAIEILTDRLITAEEAIDVLEATQAALIDQLADLTVENAQLRVVAEEELWRRLTGDAALTRANAALEACGTAQLHRSEEDEWMTTARRRHAARGGDFRSRRRARLQLAPRMSRDYGHARPARGESSRSEADRVSQATKIVRDVVERDQTTLWHTPAGDGYLTLRVGHHWEHHSVTQPRLPRLSLARSISTVRGPPPTAARLPMPKTRWTALAHFEGETHPVSVRVTEFEGRIYLDLADAEWRVVEVDADGWRIVSDSPVRFRRPRGLQALPDPVRGGSIADLGTFLNVSTEDDFRLCVAWALAALRGRGPYPILLLTAEQGSAKSTTTGASCAGWWDPTTPTRAGRPATPST